MKFPYLSAIGKTPIPSLGGSVTRPRPIIAVRVAGPTGSHLIDGLLDTGSDETVFEEWLAALVGFDLTNSLHRDIGLVGRVHPVRVHYVSVNLCVTDGMHEVCEWSAMIGFTTTKLRYPLFGYAGFLQFFDTGFHGDDCEVILVPNKKFPGNVKQGPTKP
jgi:hypothetical protein